MLSPFLYYHTQTKAVVGYRLVLVGLVGLVLVLVRLCVLSVNIMVAATTMTTPALSSCCVLGGVVAGCDYGRTSTPSPSPSPTLYFSFNVHCRGRVGVRVHIDEAPFQQTGCRAARNGCDCCFLPCACFVVFILLVRVSRCRCPPSLPGWHQYFVCACVCVCVCVAASHATQLVFEQPSVRWSRPSRRTR